MLDSLNDIKLGEKGGSAMSDFAKRATKVKENLITILEEFPETRNNDKLLMLRYWELCDDVDMTENFEKTFLASATSPESIRRARQLLQSKGLFLPTDEEVIRKRRLLQEEHRQHYAAQ